MSLHNQIFLFISLSFLVFQFNIATPTPSPIPTPTPIPISYISSSPNASPSPSPSSNQNVHVSLGNKDSVNNYVDALMQSSVSRTEEFLDKVIEKRLTDPAADEFVKGCLLVCKEVYKNAVDAMKRTMADIHREAYYSANVDLSALSTDLETCKDCVKEIYGNDQEFIKFDDWAGKVTSDAMEKIVGYSS